MGIVVLSLLPPIVGAAVGAPMWTILVLLLMRGENGVAKAASFVGGIMTVRLLQGLLFGYIFATAEVAGGGAGPDLIASTVQLVVGIFLLISAGTTWRMGDDPDGPPPKWMTLINRVSPPLAFLAGVVLMAIAMKQWLFTFSALAVIERAQLARKGSVFAYIIFVIGAQSLMLAPLIASASAPAATARMMGKFQAWLQRHYLKIAIVASLIFGVWFAWRGASGLLTLGRAIAIPATTAN